MNDEVLTDLNAAFVAVGDASATRTVYGVVIALGIIGLALLALAIWLIKQTKPEPELLAPLERMDDRAWRKQEPAEMRRDLDSLRPIGARPVLREKGVPDIDADFAQARPTLGTFDDLQAQLAADVRRTAPDGNNPLPPVVDAGVHDDVADDEVPSSEASGDEDGDGLTDD